MHVRLISMAMTGFFYTFKRPRTSAMMSMMKYDPIGTPQVILHLLKQTADFSLVLVRKKVLFLETKKKK